MRHALRRWFDWWFTPQGVEQEDEKPSLEEPHAVQRWNDHLARADYYGEMMLSLRIPRNARRLVEHPTIDCELSHLHWQRTPRRAVWFTNMTHPRCISCLIEDPYE